MNKKYIKPSRGFSFIELMLAISIISIGFLSLINYLVKEAEKEKAQAVGQQFVEIGSALSNYISKENSNLSSCLTSGGTLLLPFYTLTQATGNTVVGTCALNHHQFLSPLTSPNNMFGTGYDILIQENLSGLITGLVLSSEPIRDFAHHNSPVRYDWIGIAMREAGASSGMTFTGAPNSMKGLGGGWELRNTEFPFINEEGLLGYRVGYQGNYDDIYLRLDGAYPMRGNLNMGNYNINNATDINFNGWLNGNNALLNNLKTGYISNAGNVQTDTLNTTGRLTVGEYVEIEGLATEGDYCESSALIAKTRSGNGDLLTCVDSAWKKVGGGLTPFYVNSASTRDSGTITLDLPTSGILMATMNAHEVSDYYARARIQVNGSDCAYDRSLFYDGTTHKYSSASCNKILQPGINRIRAVGEGDNGWWHIEVATF